MQADFTQKEEKLPETVQRSSRAGFIITILVNIGVYIVVNRLAGWNISFLLDSWKDVVPFINISIYVTVIANILFLFYSDFWFYNLAHVGLNGLAIFVMYKVVRIFPFDFTAIGHEWINTGLVIVIIVGIGGVTIAMIARIARVFTGGHRE